MTDEPQRTRVVLYPLSYYDLLRRRWLRARYVARFDEIAVRYGAFRIEGAPEVREVSDEPQMNTRANAE